MASERVKELVASGKVTLHHCDVAAMPLADSTVDKVFHCNCYYFWPDLRKGASEIHRVMKPGRIWHCNNEMDFIFKACSSTKLQPVSDCLKIHYLTPNLDSLSNHCLLLMLLCTNVIIFLPLEPTQEAWWWPHWGCTMWLLWQQSEWCQGRTGARRPTWPLWETLASLKSE